MLEFVIIAVLIGGFAMLWDRFKGLERRITRLEQVDYVIPPKDHEGAPSTDVAATPAEPLPNQPPVTSSEPSIAPEPAAAHQAWDDEPQPAQYADVADEQTASGPRFQFDFEDIFGRRLPIWAGGIALAISGIFLVRYSIEAGLITPRVRVLLSMIFGLGLIAGAEAAYRFEFKVGDERVRQALAGAGLATLFGGFYLAGSGYGLIGAGAAFVGLAAVTAGAIALSHRFGLACAIVGLVGGFAAPVLVDSDGANVPLLALYLALVTGGLAWTGQQQGRSWLGYAAMAAGLGWGFLMMLGGFGGTSDVLAFGGYLIVMGTVLPAFMSMRSGPSLPQIGAGAIATLQMAYLVDDGGYSLLTWGLYLLIAAALGYLGWRNTALRAGSAVAAAIGLWLLAFWPDPDSFAFGMVGAGIVAICAIVPLALQWRSKAELLDIAQLSVVALAAGAITYVQLGPVGDILSDVQLAALMATLAIIPAASFWLSWKHAVTLEPSQTLAQLSSASLLSIGALFLLTPYWMAPVMTAIVAIALVGLLYLRGQQPLRIMAWAGAGVTLITLMVSRGFMGELELLSNFDHETDIANAMLRWGAVLGAMAALWFVLNGHKSKPVASGLTALMAYGLVAQFLPGEWLAWAAGAGAIAVAEWRKREIAGWATLLSLSLVWTIAPYIDWLDAGVVSLVGEPFLASGAIPALDLFRVIAPAILAAGLIAWRNDAIESRIRIVLASIAGALAITAIHSLYKGAWGLETLAQFTQYGMAERTIWQALMLAGAYAATHFSTSRISRQASWALTAAALAHFAWFTLILHNALWDDQLVGSLPVINLIPLAYGVALAGLVLTKRFVSQLSLPAARIAIDIAMMALISLMAVTLLRQFFAGSLLNQTPIGQTESLLISLLGIVLALGFLLWGSRTGQRSWRVGSLVLMLLAVVKVFLIDAAGLDGLLRIASFMALGFSLIGIGWFYTRQLKGEASAA